MKLLPYVGLFILVWGSVKLVKVLALTGLQVWDRIRADKKEALTYDPLLEELNQLEKNELYGMRK